MCHRSQAADKSIKDLTKFYDIEDLVKAVVLKASILTYKANPGLGLEGGWDCRG